MIPSNADKFFRKEISRLWILRGWLVMRFSEWKQSMEISGEYLKIFSIPVQYLSSFCAKSVCALSVRRTFGAPTSLYY